MELYPRTKGSWVRMVLLPFMVYVALALPLAQLIPAADNYHHNNRNLHLILPGYHLSAWVLAAGGGIQLLYRLKWQPIVSFAFALCAWAIATHGWFHV